MGTGGIVAIIIIAALVLVAFAFVSRKARNKRLDSRRDEARDLRRKANERELRGQREQALADEKAALAKRAAAEAELRSQRAQEEGRFAREHHERAVKVDPDASEKQPAGRDNS
jgi:FtsZ-interacting cell division protein ZipA